ncbi:hypothetical protein V0288_09515 [Pannus brasiliensis CCIBt3594]|uniref:Uncharacterized protein n=1 Tax=Pannus brasiliensis CCIBt3594 TaxID=1427578 RepID=A0AAW9QHS2_9CHRO
MDVVKLLDLLARSAANGNSLLSGLTVTLIVLSPFFGATIARGETVETLSSVTGESARVLPPPDGEATPPARSTSLTVEEFPPTVQAQNPTETPTIPTQPSDPTETPTIPTQPQNLTETPTIPAQPQNPTETPTTPAQPQNPTETDGNTDDSRPTAKPDGNTDDSRPTAKPDGNTDDSRPTAKPDGNTDHSGNSYADSPDYRTNPHGRRSAGIGGGSGGSGGRSRIREFSL